MISNWYTTIRFHVGMFNLLLTSIEWARVSNGAMDYTSDSISGAAWHHSPQGQHVGQEDKKTNPFGSPWCGPDFSNLKK